MKITPKTRCAFAAGLLLALAPACADSGGRARTAAFTATPSTTLAIDFGLRIDLQLAMGSAFLGDVIHTDLNADGIADLIETDFLRQKMNIALGRADGTFDTIVERNTLGKAFRLAIGDFNGDSLTDIAVANRERQGVGQQCVEVFLQGTGLDFSGSTLVYFGQSDPTDLAVSHSPSSQVDELYAAFQEERVVRILNAASGSSLDEVGSLQSANLGAAGQPFSLAFVDHLNDGGMDLIVGETRIPQDSDRVIMYPRLDLAQGTRSSNGGAFGAPQLLISPVFKPVVDNVGDADNNGFEDFAVAQLEDLEVLLVPNTNSGFSTPVAIDFGGRTSSVIFPDLDGDGLAEAVATTVNQSSIQVRRGTGPMSWGESVHYNVGPAPRAIDTILLPGDTVKDLLCANIYDLTVMIGLGDGKFRCARGYDTGLNRPSSILAADLNGNGNTDVVAISALQRSITFHEGAGDGTFSMAAELPMSASAIDRPAGLAVGDVDSDGDLDVLATIASTGEVRLYRNPGNLLGGVGGFVDAMPADIFKVGVNPSGLAIANFNADGFPDVVVSNSDDPSIQLLLNDGTGQFLPQTPLSTGSFSPAGLRCADLDADGHMDIIVAGTSEVGFELRIYSGDAVAGSLTFRASHTLDDVVNSIALADFNGDNSLDVVVGQSTFSGSDIFVFINMNDEAFGFRKDRIFIDSIGPANVMVGDMDNDTNLDISVATSGGELRVVLGDGLGGFGAPVPMRGQLPIVDNCFSASMVDVNGDQKADLLTVSKDSPFMWVGLNTSVSASNAP